MSNVVRVNKNKNFTTMGNYHLRDKNLSNKARGLLSTVLSLPPEWDYTIRGLAAICKDGIDGISAQLKELEQCGYLTRKQKTEGGKFSGMEYTFFEKPHTDSLHTDSPCTDFPYTVNPVQINTDEINTDSSNYLPPLSNTLSNERLLERPPEGAPPQKSRKFVPPKLEEVENYCRERGNAVDASQFVDYYVSVGWKVGKQSMKDWKAAVRTWERRDGANLPRTKASQNNADSLTSNPFMGMLESE